MFYLLITTIIWAFSFSIIGNYLSPTIDPWSLSFFRIAIALIIFLPVIDINISKKRMMIMAGIGAIQIGVMYIFYLNAFRFTTVPKILLFTIFTPIYVTLISDLIEKRIRKTFFVLSLGSVLGALIIRLTAIDLNDILGFLLIQGANISFAFGQVLYRFFNKGQMKSDYNLNEFVYFYIGALVVASIGCIINVDKIVLPQSLTQWGFIFWMGAIASGLGYYLWNRGATLVSAGTLAVMNNLVIPLGLIIEIIIFSRSVNMSTFIIGTLIIISSIYLSLKKKESKLL